MSSPYPAGWYPDPWGLAPWRWFDGHRWTPVLYGPYGVAWPLPPRTKTNSPRGPGVRGGGIAAAGIAVGFALSLLVGVVWAVFHQGHLQLQDALILLTGQLALWVGFLGAPILASRLHGTGSVVRDYGLSWPRWSDVGQGLLGGLLGRLIAVAVVLPYALLAHSRTGREPPTVLGSNPNSSLGWAVVVLLAVVGAPIVEELLFRGVIQGAFTRRTGAVPAIFITALVFSGMHILSEGPAAPFLIFPSAVILGWLRYRTGRLAAGMVAHATFNASLFAVLLLPWPR